MGRGNKILLGGGGFLGHMTKMVAMPIYDKNPLKVFFSGTKGANHLMDWYAALETWAQQSLFK